MGSLSAGRWRRARPAAVVGHRCGRAVPLLKAWTSPGRTLCCANVVSVGQTLVCEGAGTAAASRLPNALPCFSRLSAEVVSGGHTKRCMQLRPVPAHEQSGRRTLHDCVHSQSSVRRHRAAPGMPHGRCATQMLPNSSTRARFVVFFFVRQLQCAVTPFSQLAGTYLDALTRAVPKPWSQAGLTSTLVLQRSTFSVSQTECGPVSSTYRERTCGLCPAASRVRSTAAAHT